MEKGVDTNWIALKVAELIPERETAKLRVDSTCKWCARS